MNRLHRYIEANRRLSEHRKNLLAKKEYHHLARYRRLVEKIEDAMMHCSLQIALIQKTNLN